MIESDPLMRQLCKAVGNEDRVELMRLIWDGKRAATALREETELSKSALSQHMKILLDCGLVESFANGKFTTYKLLPEAELIVATLYEVTETLSERIGRQTKKMEKEVTDAAK
jgi:ArsR family transcriptional regulator